MFGEQAVAGGALVEIERLPRCKTGMPAIVMSTRAGSNGTPARPAAAKTRPQLGSPPAKAVLTSGEVAIVSAMR